MPGSAPASTLCAVAESVGTHGWAEQVDAAAVALVHGLDLRQVGEVLRVDWSTERTVLFDDAWDVLDDDTDLFPVQLEELDGWVVVIEPNGYLTTFEEVLVALSAGGVAVSVFWNVNARYQFSLARRGELVRSLDPFIQDWEPTGEPLPEEAGLPFGEEDASQSAATVELARRVTGVSLDGDWLLGRPHRTWSTAGPPGP